MWTGLLGMNMHVSTLVLLESMWTGLIKQLGMNMHVCTLVLLEDFESMIHVDWPYQATGHEHACLYLGTAGGL